MRRIKVFILLPLIFSVITNAQIPTNGLIAYYPLDGNAKDSSGNGNNATIVGSVTYGVDRFGNLNGAAYIPGAGSYIDCGSTLVSSSPTSLTQCVWIKTTSSGWQNGEILDKRQMDLGGDGWVFLEINNGKAMTYIDLTGYTGAQEDSSKAVVNDNNWHFLCSVKNYDTISLYVDGVLQQTVIDNTTFSSSDDYEIGQSVNGYYSGYVDDIYIYNRALSQTEISALYAISPGLPDSAPRPPSLITPANNAYNVPSSPTLYWISNNTPTSYHLELSLSSGFNTTVFNQSGLSTQATISSLPANSIFYWKVSATNSIGTSGWSSVWSFITISPDSFPGLPASCDFIPGDTLTFVASESAQFEFLVQGYIQLPGIYDSFPTLNYVAASTSVKNPGNYWISAFAGQGKAWFNLIVPNIHFPDTKDLYYDKESDTTRLYFYDSSNKVSSLPFVYTIASQAPLTAPVLTSPTNGAKGQPVSTTITWGSVWSATSYNILVSTESSFAATSSGQSGLTGLCASVSGLANNAEYYWEVSAANANGIGAWSSVWSFTVSSTAALPQKDAPNSKRISFSNSGIIYELPTASNVSLIFYNIQGRPVKQLVSGMQNAGLYSINFNHAKMPSGYYIVEFKAGTFIVQKKLALMK